MGAVQTCVPPLMGKGGPGASSRFCHSAHSTASLSFPRCQATQTPWGREGRTTRDSFHLALRLCCGLVDWASGDQEGTGEVTSPLEVLSQVEESGQRGRVGIHFLSSGYVSSSVLRVHMQSLVPHTRRNSPIAQMWQLRFGRAQGHKLVEVFIIQTQGS